MAATQDAQRVMRSFGFAMAGIVTMVRTQPNARVHLVLALLAVGLAFRLGLPPTELAVLALTMGLVLVTEAVNTAVESAVDLSTDRFHPLAQRAKDIAAGAVLLSAITAAVVGLLLFGPRLLALINR